VCVTATVVTTFGVLAFLAGCQEDKSVGGTQKAKSEAAPELAKHEATPAKETLAAQVAEQTVCPVMGGKIDKSIFVEYQGKKVYFCCASCLDTFKADPAKYVAKLPQFAK
jgi:YHS domain-containing protein